MITISRVGLPGGRRTEVEVGDDSAVERIRNCVGQTLGKGEVEVGVPLVGMKNIVQVVIPSPEDGCVLMVKVAHASPNLEVTRCPTGAPSPTDTRIYRASTEATTKLHRMLLTEFMLKDSNAGHPMSSFSLPVGMGQ